jgi:hypothetical protein
MTRAGIFRRFFLFTGNIISDKRPRGKKENALKMSSAREQKGAALYGTKRGQHKLFIQ